MPTGTGDYPADGLEVAPDSQAAGAVAEEAAKDVSEHPAQPDESSTPLAIDTPAAEAPAAEHQASPAAAGSDRQSGAAALSDHAKGRDEAPISAVAADAPAPSQQGTPPPPPAPHLNGATRHGATPSQSPQAGARLPAPSPARSPASGGLRGASVPGSHSPAVAAALGVITGEAASMLPPSQSSSATIVQCLECKRCAKQLTPACGCELCARHSALHLRPSSMARSAADDRLS